MPAEVHASGVALMEKRDIVSGGFDFIVTPDGQWCFMEVNDAGQFFFIEMWCPELPVIDAFCQFLECGHKEFVYRPPRVPIKLKEVTLSAFENGVISK